MSLLDVFAEAGGDEAVAARFWPNIDQRGLDDCWEWTAGRIRDGYGEIRLDGMPRRAHRVAFVLTYGWEPTVVMHKCDNRPCCNPRHLIGGTWASNNRDASDKGRSCRGEDCHSSRLTEDNVREIRDAYVVGHPTFTAMGERYGVTRNAIRRIVRGVGWRHVA